MLFPSLSRSCASRRVLFASRRLHSAASAVVELDYSKNVPANANEKEKPLVILHGLFGSKRNWMSLAKAFATELHRPVYALDLRNQGTSPHKEPMTYSAMAADVLHFFKTHELKNVSLLGHSMGGKVAMSVALDPDLPTGLLENLIVEDIAPSKGAMSPEFQGYIKGMQAVEAAKVKSRKEAMHILTQWEKDPAVLQFLLTNLEVPPLVEHGHFKIPLHLLEEYMDAIGDFPYGEGKRTWEGRTLFIKGTKSKYINKYNLWRAEKFFPKMQLIELPTSHWVHSEKPHDFKKAVSHFIGPINMGSQ
ncbi:Alpha/Beta hydrolase protein [Schizophyllum amplum]|uniref:Alpha/Beta hydrolase protein n=1 Tax=Schizophyllum amplum TaxID=97359 RepID=A0A550CN27_9AGAR|nr:Alpha/Beta hydrolase protein [Auriculariopsis ampla]